MPVVEEARDPQRRAVFEEGRVADGHRPRQPHRAEVAVRVVQRRRATGLELATGGWVTAG
jgi:hypothetical protein